MVVAEKSYDRLTVTSKPETAEDFHYEISGLGVHSFPLLKHSLEIQLLDADTDIQYSQDPTEVFMDRDHISFPLYLRSSKPGDRFRPLGLGGGKKVKDFFIDAKVARRQRRRIPILCSKEHIAWIVGHRLDDRVKITPETKRVLRLVYLEDGKQEVNDGRKP
jgi:tRNA(Ile)-lysidine synthase